MVLVAIFSETGFFDYCAVKVSDDIDRGLLYNNKEIGLNKTEKKINKITLEFLTGYCAAFYLIYENTKLKFISEVRSFFMTAVDLYLVELT